MTRMIPGILVLAAMLWLLLGGIRTIERRVSPPAPTIIIEEPDLSASLETGLQPVAAPVAAPMCTIPGPPRPLERDRGNPLEVRELV